MDEFWDSLLTEKSWKILQELKKEYNFILIGGWAVYLLTKQKKSRDVDIVVDIKELEKFKKNNLRKNENLKKYEIKSEEIDIDIYVEYYSKLIIPVEDLKKYTTNIEGFTLVLPEILVILKQNAHINREFSVKGEKDKIDIISLLFFPTIDFKKYSLILNKYQLNDYFDKLKRLVKEFKDYNSFNLTPREFKVKKNKILGEMKKT